MPHNSFILKMIRKRAQYMFSLEHSQTIKTFLLKPENKKNVRKLFLPTSIYLRIHGMNFDTSLGNAKRNCIITLASIFFTILLEGHALFYVGNKIYEMSKLISIHSNAKKH